MYFQIETKCKVCVCSVSKLYACIALGLFCSLTSYIQLWIIAALHVKWVTQQWTCSETIHLCWKEESPFQRCLFGSAFPVALCPLSELLSRSPVPWPLTLPLFWHNGPFVPVCTTAVRHSLPFFFLDSNTQPNSDYPCRCGLIQEKFNRKEEKCSKLWDWEEACRN